MNFKAQIFTEEVFRLPTF